MAVNVHNNETGRVRLMDSKMEVGSCFSYPFGSSFINVIDSLNIRVITRLKIAGNRIQSHILSFSFLFQRTRDF
jgi:hypothetical protein